MRAGGALDCLPASVNHQGLDCIDPVRTGVDAIFDNLLLCSSVFFFQAEDGIRDHCVTGVQTCALPISLRQADTPPPSLGQVPVSTAMTWSVSSVSGCSVFVLVYTTASPPWPKLNRSERRIASGVRSEERRVGKECRCRW